jgi:hypothetical protein
MKTYNLSVEVGYALRTVSLSEDEFKLIKSGKPLSKEVEDYYEGDLFVYQFKFNQDPQNSLTVTYDSGVGFLGDIDDAFLEVVE